VTRAFIAIRPPAQVLDAIAARVGGVDVRHGRPTTREQWHMTLQFLGNDVDLAGVAAVFERDPLDLHVGEIRLGGADTIGAARRARILMLGVVEGSEWLQELATQVVRRVASVGYVPENAFLAHLTLARFRSPADLRALCATIGPEPVGPVWRVDEAVLFESELRPDGARHIARAVFPLAR
jgi:2'-5' RNA ligase